MLELNGYSLYCNPSTGNNEVMGTSTNSSAARECEEADLHDDNIKGGDPPGAGQGNFTTDPLLGAAPAKDVLVHLSHTGCACFLHLTQGDQHLT